MWQRTRPYLIALSAALNLSFVAMWIAHAAPSRLAAGPNATTTERKAVWCPLHRELGVTQEQWRQIEPRLKQFQAGVGELGEQVDRLRAEVIDLLAAKTPDLDAVRVRQEKILATKRTMQGKVVAHLLAEKEVLTAQQQQRLFQMLRERTGCASSDPPLSGRNLRRGMGQVLRGDANSERSGGSP
ncbi:MAG: hypothetical protein MUE50_05715 [Pirellulaceae bacterium]|jgi:Spy/CpxP family protein refolding chaperone|nr:hypothetical protein [Pirellulaceae bacterium]MCU0978414.1 hypothetical protein [Pirellulaceae bacterium]